jgi:hypothetical protein
MSAAAETLALRMATADDTRMLRVLMDRAIRELQAKDLRPKRWSPRSP